MRDKGRGARDEGRADSSLDTGNSELGNGLVPRPASLTTTDPQHELFEVLTPDGSPTGVAKARGLVHRDGDWHGALHIWVGGVGEDGEPFVLFQRRSMTKDTWPGALDVAIGGHVRFGETLEETVREAEEEIGLRVTLGDLTRAGRRYVEGGKDGVIDREIQEVFVVSTDLPLTGFRLHPEEVDAIVAIPIAEALRLFSNDVDTVTACQCRRDLLESASVRLNSDDFAVRDFRYPQHVLPALQAVIEGNPVEPFELR